MTGFGFLDIINYWETIKIITGRERLIRTRLIRSST